MVPSQPKANPSAESKESRSVTATKFQAEFFSGPIPPPSYLARYNEVVPQGADRILAMAERQSKHRELLEAQVIAGNLRSQSRGSVFAFIIALVAIIGGMFLIEEGDPPALPGWQ